MLTAALAAGKSTIETAYDIDDLAEELDFMHIMAYDYHGKWDGRTGHNAPLYSREDEPEEEKTLNVVSGHHQAFSVLHCFLVHYDTPDIKAISSGHFCSKQLVYFGAF